MPLTSTNASRKSTSPYARRMPTREVTYSGTDGLIIKVPAPQGLTVAPARAPHCMVWGKEKGLPPIIRKPISTYPYLSVPVEAPLVSCIFQFSFVFSFISISTPRLPSPQPCLACTLGPTHIRNQPACFSSSSPSSPSSFFATLSLVTSPLPCPPPRRYSPLALCRRRHAALLQLRRRRRPS